MLYQALLRLGQMAVTMIVTQMIGVAYPQKGMIAKWFTLDFCISMFLVTYASVMMNGLYVQRQYHLYRRFFCCMMPLLILFHDSYTNNHAGAGPAWLLVLHYTAKNGVVHTNFSVFLLGLRATAPETRTSRWSSAGRPKQHQRGKDARRFKIFDENSYQSPVHSSVSVPCQAKSWGKLRVLPSQRISIRSIWIGRRNISSTSYCR